MVLGDKPNQTRLSAWHTWSVKMCVLFPEGAHVGVAWDHVVLCGLFDLAHRGLFVCTLPLHHSSGPHYMPLQMA